MNRSFGLPICDRNRIAELEERLALASDSGLPLAGPGRGALAELEMLADLYMQADSYVPALETIERLLALPAARTLSSGRRAALESRMVACRLGQGDCQGALAHCRDLLAIEDRIDSPALRARIRLQCADALFRLGRLDDAQLETTTALALADSCGDLGLSAKALNDLGRVHYRRGNLHEARDLYEQALGLYRRLGDDVRAAFVRNNLGLIHKNLCEWDPAAACLRAALEAFRRAGLFPSTAHVLLNLGIVCQKSGEWERAEECYGQAEQVFHQLADGIGLATVRIARGNVARLQRRFSDAEALYGDALQRSRRHAAAREEVLALEFLGELDADRERPLEALARYDQALMLAETLAPEGDLVAELERRRSEALTRLGRLDQAQAACDRALRLSERIGDRLEFALSHRAAAAIAAARGRHDEAVRGWNDTVRLLTEVRERFELARTLFELGRATADPRERRHRLYRASALFAELSADHWLQRADEELQTLLATAPQEPVLPLSPPGRRHRAPTLVAYSHDMQRVETLARRAAATDLSVLITGDTGTGKELIARTIHALSTRAERPFLAVNCGALRAELALSQLFGHRKGSFTGAHADAPGLVEAAGGGTLCLDEVGELPLDVQVTLLRFLESGEYLRLGETRIRRADVRIIASTNRELRSTEGERAFRRDLLFRLNEIEIRVPPLRERMDDIIPLARHFLAFYGGIQGPQLTADAEAVLLSHPWPGNVRELENLMKRVGALHAGQERLDAQALLPFLSQIPAPRAQRSDGERERAEILAAYREAGRNKSRVAELLGVSRKTLYARLKRLHITLP
jgi:DNA-binding NtrC family response regulator/Tfp pilus assembly protein PilF